HVVAVAIDDVLDDLCVAIAGDQALAHEDAKIVCEVGVGFIDRFILADDAAQTAADLAGARLERRVGQHLLWLHGGNRLRGHRPHRRQQQPAQHKGPTDPPAVPHHRCYPWLGGEARCRGRQSASPGHADAIPAIGQRNQAADHHDDGPDPQPGYQRVVIDAYGATAIALIFAEYDVEIAEPRRADGRFRGHLLLHRIEALLRIEMREFLAVATYDELAAVDAIVGAIR